MDKTLVSLVTRTLTTEYQTLTQIATKAGFEWRFVALDICQYLVARGIAERSTDSGEPAFRLVQ